MVFAIKLRQLNSSDILTTFERVDYSMKEKLKNQKDCTYFINELAPIAQSYISSYHPTTADFKKYRILQHIKKTENIIPKPDKENGAVIMDRQVYKNSS